MAKFTKKAIMDCFLNMLKRKNTVKHIIYITEIIIKCISVYLTLLAYILDCNPVKRFVFQYM